MSTGIYVFKPFSLAQKNSGEGVVYQKLITVYNRFDNDIGTIEIPGKFDFQKFDTDSEIVISTQKKQYERGENVKVRLDIPDYKVNRYKEVLTFAGVVKKFS